MSSSPSLVNPTLGYKLDPGEPGVAFVAPASQSIARVMNQEFANYIDFKKQAAEQRGFIISGNISLDLQKRGSFLAAVAGKTKVLIYIPGKGYERPLPNQPDEHGTKSHNEPDDIRKGEIERKIDELYRKLQMTNDPIEREKLSQQILMLTMAINALSFGMKMPEFLIGMLLNTAV